MSDAKPLDHLVAARDLKARLLDHLVIFVREHPEHVTSLDDFERHVLVTAGYAGILERAASIAARHARDVAAARRAGKETVPYADLHGTLAHHVPGVRG